MAGNWQQVNLGDVVNINPPRQLQRGHYSVHVAMEHLQPNTRSIRSYSYRNFTGSGSRFCNYDTLLARITPCLENGKTAFVDFLKDNEIGHGSTEFIVLSGKEGISDDFYVYYLARLPAFREFAISLMEGTSGRQRVPANALERFEFYLPPLLEQKAIAHILGTLDDKIELNQQMNRNLEAIASAIFKSWFVDFDPVRAKIEGREPAGMDAATAALFPDSLEDSRLGKIPKGWGVKTLGEVLELAYGKALKEDNRRPGDIPVFGSNGQIGWHDEKLVDSPGIVVGRKGNPGTVIWCPTAFFPIDTTFYVVPKDSIQSKYYLLYALRSQDLPSLSADSAVPGLNRNLAYMNHILVPFSKCLSLFDSYIQGVYEKIQANNEQSRTLATIRDALLPKLMSGEIRVKEAEKILEDVA